MSDNRQSDDDKARSLKSGVEDDGERKDGAVDENMEAKRAAFRAMVDPLRRATEGREHTPAEELIREDRDRGHRPHLGF